MTSVGAMDLMLRRAGIPIDGVDSAGRVSFKAEATAEQRLAAAEVMRAFDPGSRPVIEAVKADIATKQLTPALRAFYLWWYRKTYLQDPDAGERAKDEAALIQAFKDIA